MAQPRILTGTDDFKTLLLNSDVFVDKSMLVKEIIESTSTVLLITRPRRWGKSLNMDMVEKFFAIEVDKEGNPLPLESRTNNKLFAGGEIDLGLSTGKKKLLKKLKIAEYDEIMQGYQGQFPVISISFKDVKGRSYQEIEKGVKDQIIELYVKYDYLTSFIQDKHTLLKDAQKEKLKEYLSGELDKASIKASLRFLSEVLYKHFGRKVYILIDEYDTPINSAYIAFGEHNDEFKQVTELFGGMFGSALKDNEALEKGMITGILRIAKASLFSDLNNVREYTLLDKYFAEFYGFTQGEVEELLSKVSTATPPDQIKDWYNGYTFCEEVIYNPWSIMLCLASEGKLDHYWLDSGGTGLIDKILLSDEMQHELQELAAGGSIVSPITKQIIFSDIHKPVGLFSLLLFSGYLNPKPIEPEENIYELSVPNKEVKYIYENRVLQWVTDKLNSDSFVYYSFVSLLAMGKVKEFEERLQELLHNATSFHQTGPKKAELFYNGFMLGMINMLAPSYIIESDREAGKGRPDIVLMPKVGKSDQAIIIEYKITDNTESLVSVAQNGLRQINGQGYDTKIKEHSHIKKIIKIAMAFCGKEVAMEYQIDQL